MSIKDNTPNTSLNFLKPKKYRLNQARKISREMHDTNATIAGMSRNYSQLFISDGFTIDLGNITENLKFTKSSRSLFVDGSPLDNGVQNIIFETLRSGDILIYFTRRTNHKGIDELKIDYIMADRICTPGKNTILTDVKTNNKMTVDEFYIEDGVVISRGETLGYCVAPNNNIGDWLFFPAFYDGAPVATLYSLPIKYNPASKRNFPIITPGLQIVDVLDAIMRSETVSTMLKAKISFILEYDIDGFAKIQGAVAASGKNEDDYFEAQINKLMDQVNSNDIGVLLQKPGVKINMQKPDDHTNQNYEKAIMPYLRQLSNLYGVNYAALCADGRAETGTTAKIAYQMANSTMSAIREHFYDLILRPFIELWCEFNNISIPEKIDINTRAYGFSRANEEITSIALAMENKLMSREQAIASIGLPPRETISEIEKDNLNIIDTGA